MKRGLVVSQYMNGIEVYHLATRGISNWFLAQKRRDEYSFRSFAIINYFSLYVRQLSRWTTAVLVLVSLLFCQKRLFSGKIYRIGNRIKRISMLQVVVTQGRKSCGGTRGTGPPHLWGWGDEYIIVPPTFYISGSSPHSPSAISAHKVH